MILLLQLLQQLLLLLLLLLNRCPPQSTTISSSVSQCTVAWRSGNVFHTINEVTLRRAGLVLLWVGWLPADR